VLLTVASIIIIIIVVARTCVSDASGSTSMIGKNFSLEMCFYRDVSYASSTFTKMK
jgi:hypothetical protein